MQSKFFVEYIVPLSQQQKQDEQDLSLYVAAPPDDRTRYPFHIALAGTPMDFIYCLSGKAIISLSDKHNVTTEIGKDECIAACLPGMTGEVQVTRHPFRAVLLQVSQGFLEKWICWESKPLFHGHLLFPRENLTPYMERMAQAFGIGPLLQQIVFWPEKGPMAEIYITAKKYELFYKQMELHGGSPPPGGAFSSAEIVAAHNVYRYLRQNIATPPCLAKLAAAVGLNRGKLTAIFRQVYGDTVFGVLRRERLKQAHGLLAGDRDKNITEIAYLCGFSSPGHLTKSFAAQFGMTPKQFRKNKGNRPTGARRHSSTPC